MANVKLVVFPVSFHVAKDFEKDLLKSGFGTSRSIKFKYIQCHLQSKHGYEQSEEH